MFARVGNTGRSLRRSRVRLLTWCPSCVNADFTQCAVQEYSSDFSQWLFFSRPPQGRQTPYNLPTHDKLKGVLPVWGCTPWGRIHSPSALIPKCQGPTHGISSLASVSSHLSDLEFLCSFLGFELTDVLKNFLIIFSIFMF